MKIDSVFTPKVLAELYDSQYPLTTLGEHFEQAHRLPTSMHLNEHSKLRKFKYGSVFSGIAQHVVLEAQEDKPASEYAEAAVQLGASYHDGLTLLQPGDIIFSFQGWSARERRFISPRVYYIEELAEQLVYVWRTTSTSTYVLRQREGSTFNPMLAAHQLARRTLFPYYSRMTSGSVVPILAWQNLAGTPLAVMPATEEATIVGLLGTACRLVKNMQRSAELRLRLYESIVNESFVKGFEQTKRTIQELKKNDPQPEPKKWVWTVVGYFDDHRRYERVFEVPSAKDAAHQAIEENQNSAYELRIIDVYPGDPDGQFSGEFAVLEPEHLDRVLPE